MRYIFPKSIFIAAFVTALRNSGAQPVEPPRQCEISHGAWCIMKGAGEIRFTTTPESNWNTWTIIDNHWHRTVGIVREPVGCTETPADTVEVVQVLPVRRDGMLWREAVVRLRKDDRCQLRLMVPLGDRSFQKKAASALTGSVAACLKGVACAENVLSTKVYPVLE